MSARAIRSSRATTWEIEPLDLANGDQVEVRQGRRRKGVFDTEALAKAFIGPRRLDGQKVVVIEPDGYRMDITRQFKTAAP